MLVAHEAPTAEVGRGESAAAFKGNFTNPQVRRLWLAGVGSVIGLWAYSVALAVVLRLLVPVGSERPATVMPSAQPRLSAKNSD